MTECASQEERAERYVTVSVGFFMDVVLLAWVLVSTLDKLISSKPDMWPALMRMFGLVHLNFEGSLTRHVVSFG